MVSRELIAEIKMILHSLRIAGCEISRKTTIVVGTGFLQSTSPEVLLKNGANWQPNRPMESWNPWNGERAKREMNPALYEELLFSWKKDIVNLVLQRNIPEEYILNLDQTPLALVSVSKETMEPTGWHTISTIYLGFSFFNGFQRSNFTIHIGYQVARDKIPGVPGTKVIKTSR